MTATSSVGFLCAAALAVLACAACEPLQTTGREPIVGLPCEGCEAVFEGLPEKLANASRIAPAAEPGQPLRIDGKVTHPDGTAAPGVVVYAYQTNAKGVYPPNRAFQGQSAYRHGLLRGWAKSGADGTYRFDTIRPAGYPNSDMPQHVHMHVLEPGRCTYYIDDVVFADDPRLTPAKRSAYASGRGGNGICTPRRDGAGVLRVERDIVLGKGVPGYPAR